LGLTRTLISGFGGLLHEYPGFDLSLCGIQSSVAGVFLSYRRKDGDFAVLLYAWLVERFGAERVFWDREDIDPGSDFRQVLSTTLGNCDALVALIGPQWSPSPWIQREIGASMKRRILVLPVLLGDAPNIDAAALPRAMRRFASLQTLETRDLRFRDRLLKALDRVVGGSADTITSAPQSTDDLRTRRLIDLLQNQIDQRQQRALQGLVAGDTDAALDVLNETFDLVMALIDFRPGDSGLELRLGYLYKDLAQVFRKRDRPRFNRYVENGQQTFQRLVKLRLPKDQMAGSWNGLGNMYLLQEDFDKAVECCGRAVRISPDYSYAWNDLFQALEGQAQKGKLNLPAMRQAFQGLKTTVGDDRLLTPEVSRVEVSLRQWEDSSKGRSRKTKTAKLRS
jgi:tetratricopeptide (TPR) repeat protein